MSDPKNSLKANFMSRFGTNMQYIRAMANKHPDKQSPFEKIAVRLHRLPTEDLKKHAETSPFAMEKQWATEILQCREMGSHEQLK